LDYCDRVDFHRGLGGIAAINARWRWCGWFVYAVGFARAALFRSYAAP
jgi:hypothetical protein